MVWKAISCVHVRPKHLVLVELYRISIKRKEDNAKMNNKNDVESNLTYQIDDCDKSK